MLEGFRRDQFLTFLGALFVEMCTLPISASHRSSFLIKSSSFVVHTVHDFYLEPIKGQYVTKLTSNKVKQTSALLGIY